MGTPSRSQHVANIRVVVTGTDPSTGRGGIATALCGYLAALRAAGVASQMVTTHHPVKRGGKSWLWLCAISKIVRLVRSARKAGNCAIVYSHVGAGISVFRESVILALSRWAGSKTVLQIHAFQVAGYLQSWWKRRLFKAALAGVDVVAVLTPWWRRTFRQAGIVKPIAIVPNPLQTEWEELARTDRTGNCSDGRSFGLRILAMTRLVPGKGVESAIDALSHLPESVQLTVAGEGSERKALEDRVRKLRLEQRVRFTGWVSGDEKQRLFDEADVFCLPSAYDSFGMGFTEAMANGLPVVALRWGPIADVVAHGQTGFLVEKADGRTIAEAIGRLMDPELRRRQGREGKKRALDQFSPATVGQILVSTLLPLAGSCRQ